MTLYMGIPSPCKDCHDRHEACHDTCDWFREYRRKIEEVKDKRYESLRYTKPNVIPRRGDR